MELPHPTDPNVRTTIGSWDTKDNICITQVDPEAGYLSLCMLVLTRCQVQQLYEHLETLLSSPPDPL
jgi:hypothetical protein